MEKKIEELKTALEAAADLAEEIAADKTGGASGHAAAILGKLRGAQEMHGFLAKIVASKDASAAGTAKAE